MSRKKIEITKNEEIWKRINRFVQYNTYAITAGILLTFVFLDMKIGSLSDRVEETLVKNTDYIKRNIGHPIFLSATGQVIVAKKSPMSYYDDRFKQYLVNNITDRLIMGLVRLSGNYKIRYYNGKDILKKNKEIKAFIDNFLAGRSHALIKYADSLYLAMVEKRLPEYIDILNAKTNNYSVRKDPHDGKTHISFTLEIRAIIKSWIKDLGRWDTREISIRIPAELIIDPSRYANIGNPFGIYFKEIDIPAILKPTPNAVMQNVKR